MLYYGLDQQPATAPDGRLVLRRAMDIAGIAAQLKIAPEQAAKLVGQATLKLQTARSHRRVPGVDPAVLVDRNALMDAGFIAAGEAFRISSGADRVGQSRLSLRPRAPGRGHSYCHVARDGEPCVHGLAADQVYMLDALLAAYRFPAKAANWPAPRRSPR